MEKISCASVLISAVFVFLGALYIYFKHKFNYWEKKGVLFLKPSFPTGNCRDFVLLRKSFGETYTELYNTLAGNKFGGVYLLHRPQLIIREPDLIKAVLVKDFDHFHDRGFTFDEKIDPLSGNLFLLNGSKWRELRTKLSPTFTSGKMKLMFQTVINCGMEIKEHLKTPADQGEMVEFRDVLAKYSTDIIASCAFGIECNCLKNPDAEFRKWGRRIFETTFDAVVRGMLYFLVPSVPISLGISGTPNDITTFFRTLVHETVKFREKHSINRNDFLQLLIRLKNQESLEPDTSTEEFDGKSAGMTMDELAAQVFIFFIAGFETSSTTMSFCLYELALNPDIQRRVQDEIDSVLQKHDGNITHEAILQMEYLDKTVAETLRKYPPVTVLNRECTKDYPIPGTNVIIEKGTPVIIPVEAIHHDPQYFPEPDRFDPERFSEEAKSGRHRFVYLPFGEGPRICIGMRFGLMQTKVGLISVLSNYEVSVCEKTSIPLKKDPKQFINIPAAGIWLQIRNRVTRTG